MSPKIKKRNFKKIRSFNLTKDKKIKLHFKGPFIANGNCFNIQIDEYFDRFTIDEQTSIIWHEYYHHTLFWGRLILMLKGFFNKYNAKKLEEFEADKYSAINNGKLNLLKALKRIEYLDKQEIVKTDLKNHPPIKERIKRIKELNIK